MTTLVLPQRGLLLPRFEIPNWIRGLRDPLSERVAGVFPQAYPNRHQSAFLTSDVKLTAVSSPTALTGLKLWYDASQLTGYTDGLSINPFTDFSGNGWNASDATSSHQPIYKASILNGKPISRWDGTVSQMTVASGAFGILNNVASCTIVAVASTAAVAASVRKAIQFNTNASGAAAARIALAVNNTTAARFTPNGRRADADANQIVTGNQKLVANIFSIFALTVTWSAQTLVTYLNGGIADGSATFSTSGNTPSTNSNTIQLGNASGSNFWSGDLADLVVFVPKLSLADLNSLGAYFSQKWGVPWWTAL